MAETLLGKRILVITAHPDDEAFLAAGTTYMNYKRRGTTGLICATLGEKGSSHLGQPVSKAKLKRIRKRELLKAAKLTHLKPRHVLGLPDGGLSKKLDSFYRRALPIAKRFKPEIILTFGPDGITGHRDHVTAHKVAKKIAKQLHTRLCVFTVAPRIAKQAPSLFKRNRVNPHYQRIVPYQPSVHRIKISPVHKQRVLRQYVSQIDSDQPYRSWPKGVAHEFKNYEHFGEIKP